MCFNPSPVRRVPSPNRYMVVAKFCFCKSNKRLIIDYYYYYLVKLLASPLILVERAFLWLKTPVDLSKLACCFPGQNLLVVF